MGAHVAGGGNHHGDHHDDRDNGAVDNSHGDSKKKTDSSKRPVLGLCAGAHLHVESETWPRFFAQILLLVNLESESC